MATRYYRVREKKHPENNGIVVRLKDGQLECIAGEKNQFRKHKLSTSRRGNLKVPNKYFMTEISPQKAHALRRDYEAYSSSQALAMGDAQVGSKL